MPRFVQRAASDDFVPEVEGNKRTDVSSLQWGQYQGRNVQINVLAALYLDGI